MPVPPRKTLEECREKISEMIGEAVVEDDDARREGLLTLADLWGEVADRHKDENTPARRGRCDPGEWVSAGVQGDDLGHLGGLDPDIRD
jgi:CBS domain containing-hemolysin-like protein